MTAGAAARTTGTPLDPAGGADVGGGAGGPARATDPCLHCGFDVPVRLMGCKGGHCPNCRHPYPHGDCSD